MNVLHFVHDKSREFPTKDKEVVKYMSSLIFSLNLIYLSLSFVKFTLLVISNIYSLINEIESFHYIFFSLKSSRSNPLKNNFF